MATTHTHTLTVCECCYLVVGTGDDSSCRDYYGHEHAECELGLEQNETAVPADSEDSAAFASFRCAGCGDDYVGGVHYLNVLTSV